MRFLLGSHIDSGQAYPASLGDNPTEGYYGLSIVVANSTPAREITAEIYSIGDKKEKGKE